MSTVCIIQARTGSTRLPGKVLKTILGKSVLYWDIHRAKQCKLIDKVVIATTTLPQDDIIVESCKREGWECTRGDENDLLDRYLQCAKLHEASTIVRITSDCPLIDPTVSDNVIAAFNSANPSVDLANNYAERSYPIGLETEVFSLAALERIWHADKDPAWREHVTTYFYYHPEEFRSVCVKNPVDYSHYRLTLDTPEDFELITKIYQHFGHGDFTWQEVTALLDSNPELVALNKMIKQKVV